MSRFLSVAASVLLTLCVFWVTVSADSPTPLQAVERETPLGPMHPGEMRPFDPSDTVAADSPGSDPNQRVSVLVTFDPQLEDASFQRQEVKSFAAEIDARVQYEYKVLPNLVNLRDVRRGDIDFLRAMPGVVNVEEDVYHPNLVSIHTSVPLINAQQGQIQAAGFNVDGAGVRVCIIDTGIDSDHVMYSTRIDASAGFDFHNNDPNPEDDNGHGAHVAGIAVGGTGLSVNFGCPGSVPFEGVAPAATLIGVKVLDQNGGGFGSNIIAGIDHCADQSGSGGRADVINLSLGTGAFSGNCTHSWAVAANNAANNGVVVVAASGNEGNANAMISPACGSEVISVGATYKEDYPNCEEPTTTQFTWCLNQFCTSTCTDNTPSARDLICFSNQSDFLDVSGPGCRIWSASNAAGGGQITTQCGTSQASPHVAGLAALLLDEDPSLTPAQVRQALRDGAIDLGPAGFDRGYGFGFVDAVGSLQQVGTGGCSVNPDCDDGLFCNGVEICNGGTCEAGTPPNCDDGVSCTIDSCNEGTDSCDNDPDHGACSNGLFCDGAETCDPILGCLAGSNPCPGQFCDEGSDTCVDCLVNGDCDDGLFCNGAETCVGGSCQAGSNPCPGQSCDEDGDFCFGGAAAQLETGTTSAGGTAVTVNLTHTYVSPVVVCSVNYNNNTSPVVARVSSVTPTSFDVRLQNPSGGAVSAETINYLVVEEGVWTIDGVNVEAATYLSTVTDENNSWVGEARTYGQSYTNPVVLGQVMSENDPDWSVFWDQGDARTSPPGAAFLRTGKTVAEDTDVTRANETVGYVVFEAGHGTIGGVEFEAALGADTVLGVDNSPPFSYTFNTAFAFAPQVNVTTMAAMDGNNGGWAQTHGATQATTTTLFLSIDEDQIGDAERAHTTEQVAYVSFESAFAYPSAGCSVDPDCDDGLFCNGAETCNAGTCQAGTPPDCDDGVSCTVDSCNEGTDSCDHTPNNGVCDNGLFCDGAETCDPLLDCQAGTPPDCDDGVSCTVDSCNEGTDSCDNTPDDGFCDDGLFCNGAETCDPALDCQTGTDPCPGQSCDEDGDFCFGGGPTAQLETHTVGASGAPATVNLTNTYTSAVVVCSAEYVDNITPIVPRVSNVTATSFDVRLQNPSDGPVASDRVNCLVVEEGVWTIDGVNIEAQTYLSTVTDENNSWVGEAQTYGQSYTNPVVLGQVMSENDPDWSVFWDQGSSRTNPPSATVLRTGKTVCEDSDVTRANETVGFIVIEAGHGTINGVEYEAALGADTVQGVTNSPPYAYTFNTPFSTAPAFALVTMAAVDGGNGGWAQTHGANPTSATSLDLSVDEDQILDAERNHITEQVGYIVFETQAVYP